jgi:antitoxin (DNA-binding transcriptional repressor) of toxin-antitoxin stability system
MATITLEEAQAHLPELIDRLAPGEEVTIIRDAVPVGKLVKAPAERPRPVPGGGQGKLIILADDDEHLKDFAEYMP